MLLRLFQGMTVTVKTLKRSHELLSFHVTLRHLFQDSLKRLFLSLVGGSLQGKSGAALACELNPTLLGFYPTKHDNDVLPQFARRIHIAFLAEAQTAQVEALSFADW